MDQFQWPRQAQYIAYLSSSSFSSYHNIVSISLLDLYYRLRVRLRLRLKTWA